MSWTRRQTVAWKSPPTPRYIMVMGHVPKRIRSTKWGDLLLRKRGSWGRGARSRSSTISPSTIFFTSSDEMDEPGSLAWMAFTCNGIKRGADQMGCPNWSRRSSCQPCTRNLSAFSIGRTWRGQYADATSYSTRHDRLPIMLGLRLQEAAAHPPRSLNRPPPRCRRASAIGVYAGARSVVTVWPAASVRRRAPSCPLVSPG